MGWLKKADEKAEADCEDCAPGNDLMHGGLVDDGRIGLYETPKDAACPECGASGQDIKRDLNENGKPRTMQPQLECKRCGKRWSLFPKHEKASEGAAPDAGNLNLKYICPRCHNPVAPVLGAPQFAGGGAFECARCEIALDEDELLPRNGLDDEYAAEASDLSAGTPSGTPPKPHTEDAPLEAEGDADGMDDTVKAYLEAALWSSNDNADDSGGQPLDANYGIENFSPEAIQQAVEDCRAFEKRAAQWIRQMPAGVKLDQLGHDFWLTRNGHGVGFWDRPEVYGEQVAEQLTEIAHSFGETNIEVGDDGKLHFLGGSSEPKPESLKLEGSDELETEAAPSRHYALDELEAMPTIHQGHTDNLKYDDGQTRVWLSRMTVEDGMPYNNQVTVERLMDGVWTTVETYDPAEGMQSEGAAPAPKRDHANPADWPAQCPNCGGAWKPYSGSLGYESRICEKCGMDINDAPEQKSGGPIEGLF